MARSRGRIDTSLECRWIPSPNFEPRKNGLEPDLLLLHYTATPSAECAVEILTEGLSPSRVSCHYLIDEEGSFMQLVSERERAWHAGISHWAGCDDINSCSIGIEIQFYDEDILQSQFPDIQMSAVESLCLDILKRHSIPPERILGHSDVAPGRKSDPGEKFDWSRLHRKGIGHWVAPEPLGNDIGLFLNDQGNEVADLQAMLQAYGYKINVTGNYDQETVQVVTAFQSHFRQVRVDGRADRSTILTLRDLLDKRP